MNRSESVGILNFIIWDEMLHVKEMLIIYTFKQGECELKTIEPSVAMLHLLVKCQDLQSYDFNTKHIVSIVLHTV